MTEIIGGTTQETAMPWMAGLNAPARRARTSTPYSSAVRERSVARRQWCCRVLPSYTPSTVCVLPTSIARNMNSAFSRGTLLGRVVSVHHCHVASNHTGLFALCPAQPQRAVIRDPTDHPLHSLRPVVYLNVSSCQTGQTLPQRPDRSKTVAQIEIVPVFQPGQQVSSERDSVDGRSGCRAQTDGLLW